MLYIHVFQFISNFFLNTHHIHIWYGPSKYEGNSIAYRHSTLNKVIWPDFSRTFGSDQANEPYLIPIYQHDHVTIAMVATYNINIYIYSAENGIRISFEVLLNFVR